MSIVYFFGKNYKFAYFFLLKTYFGTNLKIFEIFFIIKLKIFKIYHGKRKKEGNLLLLWNRMATSKLLLNFL